MVRTSSTTASKTGDIQHPLYGQSKAGKHLKHQISFELSPSMGGERRINKMNETIITTTSSQIADSGSYYDSTYFTMSDIVPYIMNGVIKTYNFEGTRRGWGRSQCKSTIVVNENGLVSIHVGFSHKHGGGQGYHHFVNGQKRTWAQLTEAQQMVIAEAVSEKAESWWKSAGKLKSERVIPTSTVAYKIVRMNDDELVSVYDATTRYEIGKKLTQACSEGHGGGYYAFESMESMYSSFKNGTTFPEGTDTEGTFAVIQVECSGKRVDYKNGKSAFTHIKPVAVIATFTA